MDSADITLIGKRIKDIRLSNSQKLSDLACDANVSKGLISKIENGRTVPSLPVLLNIIRALNVPVVQFFEDIELYGGDFNYLHFPADSFSKVEKENSIGFHYFNICKHNISDSIFDVNILILDPEATRDMVSTDGLEFIYLIDGDIEYQIGDSIFNMSEGDALLFNGRVPHLKRNRGLKSAKMIVIYFIQNEKK